MTWIALALATAFFQALKDLLIRRSGGGGSPWAMAWAYSVVTTLALAPFLVASGLPEIKDGFFVPLLAGGLLLVLTNVLYFEALSASDLSLTVPMLAATPLFMLVTSPIMLGEFPRPLGLAGMVLIVIGAWVLNRKGAARRGAGLAGLWAPFRALYRERGPRLMLLVAFLWSVTANLDKIGVERSSPLAWLVALNLLTSGLMWPAVALRGGASGFWRDVRLGARTAVWAGGLEAVSLVCQMTAITMTLTPYLISVKRVSVVLGVVLGVVVLGEPHWRERLSGAVLMVLGVALIALG